MITHGHSKGRTMSPTYRSWITMRDRCRNPNCPKYADYGGRGITIDPRWESFERFLADMGERPAGRTLDRRNNDQGYSPDNCRWATRGEQARNQRRTHNITFNGETMCLQDWAERLGIAAHTLYYRLTKHGWSLDRALTTPGMNRGRRLT